MARRTRIVLGLNSGTSADGVDAVGCEIVGRGLDMRVGVLGHVRRRYPAELRRRLLAVMAPAETRTEELCRLEVEVGGVFAEAARTLMKKLGLRQVDLVGSHGQTICHLPPAAGHGGPALLGKSRSGRRQGRRRNATASGTMQIGDPAVIAERLQAPVVAGFRQADMAAGGQGAPLVPWTDYVLFRDRRKNRVVQNIGGIANLTWLPAGGRLEEVLGFDTGPGNMLLDGLARHFSGGRKALDRDGRGAARGQVDNRVLGWMLKHPYLGRRPPKSCGREEFGQQWVKEMVKRFAGRGLGMEDWMATATAFTAAGITLAYAAFLAPRRGRYPPAEEIILCGGGAKNPTLVSELRRQVSFGGRFKDVEMTTTADYGIPVEAKEGVSFAMLAAACVDGVPANLPQATGARRRVVLGQVCWAEPRR
jgi:anhydro-N-acetylmuramic acid kinase